MKDQGIEKAIQISQIISEYCGINYQQIYSKSRKAEIVEARQFAMTIIYKYCRLNMAAVAQLFNRDRATLFHARKKISDICEYDKAFQERYMKLVSYVKSSFETTNKIKYTGISVYAEYDDGTSARFDISKEMERKIIKILGI